LLADTGEPALLNAFSIDLEEYFQVANFDRYIDRSHWAELPSRAEPQTHRLLDLCDETRTRATFFVLGWVAERHPQIVREIAARGHEVACHGYGHELLYEIGPERFREDLKRARGAIGDAGGTAVVGYRAPSFSITERSLWALEILAEEGFQFDSSIFPVRHHRYGIPSFSRDPVRLVLPSGRTIVEFPLTALSFGPLGVPVAGGGYLRLLPFALLRWGIARLVSARRPTVLYVHNWEIDAEQPRQQVPALVRWNHYHNLERVEERLRVLLRRARYAAMSDVLRALDGDARLATERLA
jgi:polysaccharide deacetylase family protein (PEP-CTERM system associated)